MQAVLLFLALNIKIIPNDMQILSNSLIFAVALQHLGFLVLEMFFWARPLGLKIFKQSLEEAKASQVLAANQGLYNGFLAAGLFWGLLHPSAQIALQLKIFFLACIILAGAYGGYSVRLKILIVQAIPAVVALMALIIS